MKQKSKTLSDAEMGLLQVLNEIGPATAQQVRSHLPNGEKTAYSTVITLLQRMEEKGYITHSKSSKGKAFLFEVAMNAEKIRKKAVQSFITRYFQGDPVPLFTTLVETRGLKPEEIAELKELLERLTKEQ